MSPHSADQEIFDTKGISLIVVIIIMMILATIGLLAGSLLSSGNIIGVTELHMRQAFYIAEAGMSWYLKQLESDGDWSNPPQTKTDEPFAGGNFTITYSNPSIDAIDITSIGTITGWDGNLIRRCITRHVEKQSNAGKTFADFAIFFGGGDGTINTNVNKDQIIRGDIFIKGDLEIGRDCNITGDISATGTISVGEGTYISGTITQYAILPVTQPTLTTSYYDDLITIASNQPAGDRTFNNESISGTMYINGDVTIRNALTATMPARIVSTGSVDIKNNADIGDGITIISGGGLVIRKGSVVGKNVIFYSSSDIELKSKVSLGNAAGSGEGVVLLSKGDIVLGDSISLTGFIFGDDITIGEDFSLIGNLSGNRLISLGRDGIIDRDNTKVDYSSIEGFDPGLSITIITSLWQEVL